MKYHYEPDNDCPLACRIVVDSRKVYTCDKGHQWREEYPQHLDMPLPISLGLGDRLDGLCPYCLGDKLEKLLKGVGRVSIEEVEGEK